MPQSLTTRYDDRIAGVLSCYDRVVITGTLPGICYADGMTRYLHSHEIRIFDYPDFANRLRLGLWEQAEALAADGGSPRRDQGFSVLAHVPPLAGQPHDHQGAPPDRGTVSAAAC